MLAESVPRPRLVSLVPSVTELLFELGVGDQVVGVSHQCHFPPPARSKPALTRDLISLNAGEGVAPMSSADIDAAYTQFRAAQGSPYALDAQLLSSLAPDVIFDQGICDVCAVGEATVDQAAGILTKIPDVITISAATLEGILDSIGVIGRAAGVPERAADLARSLHARMELVQAQAQSAGPRPRVFCLEWLDPVWCAGHWVPEMVTMAGGDDALGKPGAPSVRQPWEQVLEVQPEVIVLMPCSYPMQRTLQELPVLAKLPGWAHLPAVQQGRVWVAASPYFSHHSHRTFEGLEMLAHVIHPEVFPSRWLSSRLRRLAHPAEGRA